FSVECIKNGMTQLPRLWWHSHNNMGAFFSGTDDTAIEDLANDSFTIALVINKRAEMKAVLRVYHPIDALVDLEIVIDEPRDDIPEEILAEVVEKVKEKPFLPI